MNTSARSSRLVTGLAVAGVTIAALGAVANSWMADRADETAAPVQAQRPPADEPVRVVKAPAEPQASQQPAGCRDCEAPAVPRDGL
jgi:hypothetical protein